MAAARGHAAARWAVLCLSIFVPTVCAQTFATYFTVDTTVTGQSPLTMGVNAGHNIDPSWLAWCAMSPVRQASAPDCACFVGTDTSSALKTSCLGPQSRLYRAGQAPRG